MRSLAAAVLTLGLVAPASAAPPDVLPFADVRPGMTGVGRTVFAGETIEEFAVEILATLPRIAPDRDLILAKCSGGPLERTRILSGMSGSPVFVDGKLIGAVAYSFGFSTEAIAGITPIEEMLRVGARAAGGLPSASTARIPDPAAARAALLEPERMIRWLDDRWAALAPPSPSGAVTSIPLHVSGLPARGFAAVAGRLRDLGFDPMRGAAASGAGTSGRLEPGSAVGVKLMRGDVEMTATGTVTWVDGDRVLAFGHPLFGLGDVDLPMTTARVETVLPSLVQSSRVATAGEEIGALAQDRAAGIAGRIGQRPSMIPVRVQYADGAGDKHTLRFDVADDPLLAPLLVYASLNGILTTRDRTFGDATVRVAEGSVIQIDGQDDVDVHNLYAGPQAVAYATGTTAYILHLLMNNVWEPPRVAAVNLILEYEPSPRSARVQRASLDRYRARPGETVRISAVLRPYRGEDVVVHSDITLPAETPAGTLDVLVGGSLAVSRPEPGQEPLLPAGLEQFVWLINNLRRNDRLFVLATHEDDGVFLEGARFPNLPPTAASVLARPDSHGGVTRVRRRGVLEETVPTEYAVEGLARITLHVEHP